MFSLLVACWTPPESIRGAGLALLAAESEGAIVYFPEEHRAVKAAVRAANRELAAQNALPLPQRDFSQANRMLIQARHEARVLRNRTVARKAELKAHLRFESKGLRNLVALLPSADRADAELEMEANLARKAESEGRYLDALASLRRAKARADLLLRASRMGRG